MKPYVASRFLLVTAFAVALGLLPLLPSGTPLAGAVSLQGKGPSPEVAQVCPGPAGPDTARCHAVVRPRAATSPTGLGPATIKQVYSFPTDNTMGAGKTVAIVIAYDNPTAENDLNVFSTQFGLPPCTTANGCFKKVNQTGGTKYPRKDQGWALESALDTQWAHAIAPGAKILLVEANSNSFSNLLAAVDYARKNADYVSMSWGGSEFSNEVSQDFHFTGANTSGTRVSFFASSGDSGFPASYPSASPNVISVGGTTLTLNGGNLVSETAWNGSGGGCSAYETANSTQVTGSVSCNGKRATPDVALDADPASGVSVYDSFGYQGQKGWFVVGGTSASAPMWAGRSAVAGAVVDAAYAYGTNITYRDITLGANDGASALPGYDLVTGRGSWTGLTP